MDTAEVLSMVIGCVATGLGWVGCPGGSNKAWKAEDLAFCDHVGGCWFAGLGKELGFWAAGVGLVGVDFLSTSSLYSLNGSG